MKYILDDDVIKLKHVFKDKSDIFKFELFCTFYKIHSISDFLKHGEKVRIELFLKDIIEEFKSIGLKFDDELTEEELKERNSERKRIEMDNRKKLEQEKMEELLSKSVSVLALPASIIRKLNDRAIYEIQELIDGSSFIFFGNDTSIFKESELNKITRALKQHGLKLNMLNPVTQTLDIETTISVEETEEIDQTVKRKRVKWEDRINYIRNFYNYFGHTIIPEKFTAADNIGKWVTIQRSAWKNGKLSAKKIKDLELAGMSKEGLGNSSESKARMLKSLNIKNISIEKGILYTEYLDGKVKSTIDEEFIQMLEGKEIPAPKEDIISAPSEIKEPVETSSDIYTEEEMKTLMQQAFEQNPEEIDEETETISSIESTTQEEPQASLDTYTLLQARIEDMKLTRETITKENQRKQKLIQEYRKLLHELDILTQESIELDAVINNLIGIDTSATIEDTSSTKAPLTIEEFEETKEQISQAIEEKKEENERKKALIEEFRQIEEELKTVQREKEELDSEIESIFNHDPQDKVKKIGEE